MGWGLPKIKLPKIKAPKIKIDPVKAVSKAFEANTDIFKAAVIDPAKAIVGGAGSVLATPGAAPLIGAGLTAAGIPGGGLIAGLLPGMGGSPTPPSVAPQVVYSAPSAPQSSASNMPLIIGGVGVLVVIGGLFLFMKKGK